MCVALNVYTGGMLNFCFFRNSNACAVIFSLELCLRASPTVLQVDSEFHTWCLWAEAPSLVLAPCCVQREVCVVKNDRRTSQRCRHYGKTT